MNVHQMHIARQAHCAWRDIGRIHPQSDTLCMSRNKRPTYLRAWRQQANKTLVQVAEHLHMTHGNLSKIERGLVPYNQELLEALAELYGCDPVDLLIRDPSDPNGMWTLWEQALPGERRQIVAVAEAIVKERSATVG